MKTALYRHFDSRGSLLYVGISYDPVNRTDQHTAAARWFQRVARIDVSWFDTREDAEMMESLAILRERPEYNKAKPRCGWKWPEHVYGVRHVMTGNVSGWLDSEDEALVRLKGFEREYPDELFDLLREDGRRASENYIPASRQLRHTNTHVWLGYRDMDFVPIALQDSVASAETAGG